jgi:hypothetical protein
MVREELQSASDHLRQASEAAEGETRRRLYDLSDRLARQATADRGPDHGSLARHTNALREVEDDLDGEAVEHVRSALSAISSYREGVEGV